MATERVAVVRQRRSYTLFSGAVRADVDLVRARYVIHVLPKERVPGTYFLFQVLLIDERTGAILADQEREIWIDGSHPVEPTRNNVESVAASILEGLVAVDRPLARRLDFDSRSGEVMLSWDESRAIPPERSDERPPTSGPRSGGKRGGSLPSPAATRSDRRRIARLMSLASSPNLYEAQIARAKANELLRRYGLRASDVAREFGVYRKGGS